MALLNIQITQDGCVHTHDVGMDIVHAKIVLDELDRIRPILVEHIENTQKKVIPFPARN